MFVKKNLLIFFSIILIFVSAIFFGPLRSEVNFLVNYLLNKDLQLKKSDDSINVLVLGVGGGKHDGPDLSDTIIFANIKPAKNEINLISIPRDLWISELAGKINGAYSTGQEKGGKGILLSDAVIEKVTDKRVDYTLIVDFDGFKKLIDLLGGISVDVKNTFDDYTYPIEGKENELCGHKEEEIPLLATSSSELEAFPCRYEHVHFDKGVTNMSGEKALIYVRSRHAEGVEGTDFARSARQHQVITAIKDKMFSLGTIFNPVKVFGIFNVLNGNINTDIKTEELGSFIKLAQQMKGAKITNSVIDMGDEEKNIEGLLVNPPISSTYRNQWVLIPRIGNGSFSEIHTYVSCITEGKKCSITKEGVDVQ